MIGCFGASPTLQRTMVFHKALVAHDVNRTNEVHDFAMVVLALQRAAVLSLEVAEMVALEAHTEDIAIVKRGLEKDDALIICGGLRKWTRIEGVTPGVTCEALHDDE